MKQYITPEQLQELTDEQKERLREWWTPKKGNFIEVRENIEIVSGKFEVKEQQHISYYGGYCGGFVLPLLSIGQMIELLAEKQEYFEIRWSKGESAACFTYYNSCNDKEKGDLTDALWQAVKEVL